MRFIYKNITETTQIVTLLSDDKTQVTSIPLGAGARVEVSNGNLDIYVPHILSRIDENGYDISHSVVQAAAADARNIETAKREAAKADEPILTSNPPIAPIVVPPVDAAPVEAAPKVKKGK
jgi:hypothetical protein